MRHHRGAISSSPTKKIGFRLRDLFVSCKALHRHLFFKYSLPVIISDTLLALGNNMVAIIMGHIGASFVAANAIVSQTVRLSTVFNQGLSNASGHHHRQHPGRGRARQGPHRQGVTFFLLSIAIGVAAAGIILILCPIFIANFNITADTQAIASRAHGRRGRHGGVPDRAGRADQRACCAAAGTPASHDRRHALFLWLVSVPAGATWPAWCCTCPPFGSTSP